MKSIVRWTKLNLHNWKTSQVFRCTNPSYNCVSGSTSVPSTVTYSKSNIKNCLISLNIFTVFLPQHCKKYKEYNCSYKIVMLFSARESVPQCEALLVHILAGPQNPRQRSASAAAHAGCGRGQGGITGQRACHCALQVISQSFS